MMRRAPGDGDGEEWGGGENGSVPFSSRGDASERDNDRPVAHINKHSGRSPHPFNNPYLNLIPGRRGGEGKSGLLDWVGGEEGREGGGGESETCFSLLADERLKSTMDLFSIFKRTSAPHVHAACVCVHAVCVCVCVCVCAVTRCSFENCGAHSSPVVFFQASGTGRNVNH